MKDHLEIEELLNGFIDGELTQRQQIEVQRLLLHDSAIARRLKELEKCKSLAGGLERSEAPAGMAEDVMACLERKALPGEEAKGLEQERGARDLLVRKILTAAAMISLFAVLGVVIYTIIGPAPGPMERVSDSGLSRPVVDMTDEAERASAGEGIPGVEDVAAGFEGRLELQTSTLLAVDAFINRKIEEHGLLGTARLTAEGNENTYVLSADRQSLGRMVADLAKIWERVDWARLIVETRKAGGVVTVSTVTAEQVAEILRQEDLERQVKAAKYFAVLNDIGDALPAEDEGSDLRRSSRDVVSIPKPVKPVMTSEGKVAKKVGEESGREQKVQLTIVVRGSE